MLRGAPVRGAAGVRALGPRPQRPLPLLLPAALRGAAALGAQPGLLSAGPAATPALRHHHFCVWGGFSSFLCLFVSGFHFKVYNKCFGVRSPRRTSPWQVRPLGPCPQVPASGPPARATLREEPEDSAAGPEDDRSEKHPPEHFVHGCACFCWYFLTVKLSMNSEMFGTLIAI